MSTFKCLWHLQYNTYYINKPGAKQVFNLVFKCLFHYTIPHYNPLVRITIFVASYTFAISMVCLMFRA